MNLFKEHEALKYLSRHMRWMSRAKDASEGLDSAVCARLSERFAREAEEMAGDNPSIEQPTETATATATRPRPSLGTIVTARITDNAALGKIRAHGYSKRQAWNADESLIHMTGGDFKIVDNDGNVKHSAPVSSEYNWHPTQPHLMFGTRDAKVFGLADIRDGSFIPIYTSTDGPMYLGGNEGNMDDAGLFAPLDTASAVMIIDVSNGEVVGKIPKAPNYNWHGLSHSGDFVIVENNSYSHKELGIQKQVYNREMVLQYEVDGAEHGDFVSLGGVDWYVEVGRRPSALRLSDGHIMPLAPDESWTWGHFSGRGPAGSVFYSVHQGRADGWQDYTIGEFDLLDGMASNIQWGLVDHSGSRDYVNQMKLSVSPSGRRVIYTSDADGIANDYVATIGG